MIAFQVNRLLDDTYLPLTLPGVEQIKLAKRSRVGIGTIRRMEAFDGVIGSRTETFGKIMSALEKAGIEFLDPG